MKLNLSSMKFLFNILPRHLISFIYLYDAQKLPIPFYNPHDRIDTVLEIFTYIIQCFSYNWPSQLFHFGIKPAQFGSYFSFCSGIYADFICCVRYTLIAYPLMIIHRVVAYSISYQLCLTFRKPFLHFFIWLIVVCFPDSAIFFKNFVNSLTQWVHTTKSHISSNHRTEKPCLSLWFMVILDHMLVFFLLRIKFVPSLINPSSLSVGTNYCWLRRTFFLFCFVFSFRLSTRLWNTNFLTACLFSFSYCAFTRFS